MVDSRSALAVGGTVLIAALVSATCSAPPRHGPQPSTKPIPAATMTPASADPAPTAPPPVALLSPSASSSAVTESPPPRKAPPSPSSTLGKIWCSDKTCDLATETCCINDSNVDKVESRCVPKHPDGAMAACCQGQAFCSYTNALGCDEADDCGTGVCCIEDMGEYWNAFECRPSAKGCPLTACLPGSTCRSGSACIAPDPAKHYDLNPHNAHCSDQIAAPRCGSNRCAMGELCCWDGATKSGTCAASCDEDKDVAYACTAPSDCASGHCTTILGVPSFACGNRGWVGSQLCTQRSDCPKEDITQGPGVSKLKGCLPSPSAPPGTKFCEYVEVKP